MEEIEEENSQHCQEQVLKHDPNPGPDQNMVSFAMLYYERKL